jgi:hypothetical protein
MLKLHWRDELIIEVSNSSQTLRKTYRAIFVIFITANINKITYPPNVTGVLSKPFIYESIAPKD